MSECVVRMDLRENCLDCDLHYIKYTDSSEMHHIQYAERFADVDVYCYKEKRHVGKRFGPTRGLARPDWCPILCQLPEGHGRLVDADALMELMLERKQPLIGADSSKDRYRYMQWLADFNAIRDAKTIVPAERSETKQV